ncbi:hypothetical protein [Actinoallomurus soli]|uniref:hypothetical protein n=1 Tax=Actinoallomurus soli TaxID=2952535 RepID=UPI00387398E7
MGRCTTTLVGGAEVSRLLTSVPNPAEAGFFIAWPLDRSGDDTYVQNELMTAVAPRRSRLTVRAAPSGGPPAAPGVRPACGLPTDNVDSLSYAASDGMA